MSKFGKFLKRFAGEYREVGSAIGTLALGVALDPKERQAVMGAVNLVQTAADNIEKSLKDVEKMDAAGVTDAQLKKALKAVVSELLPDMLSGMIEAGVRKALEEKAKA